MAKQVTRIDINLNLKDVIMEYFTALENAGHSIIRNLSEIRERLKSREVEYDQIELSSALTELVKEEKIGICVFTVDVEADEQVTCFNLLRGDQ